MDCLEVFCLIPNVWEFSSACLLWISNIPEL